MPGQGLPLSETRVGPGGVLTVTVRSGTVPGVELYDIEGGMEKVYEQVRIRLNELGLTEQKSLDGRITETAPAADGSCGVLLDGIQVAVIQPIVIEVPVVVPVP